MPSHKGFVRCPVIGHTYDVEGERVLDSAEQHGATVITFQCQSCDKQHMSMLYPDPSYFVGADDHCDERWRSVP